MSVENWGIKTFTSLSSWPLRRNRFSFLTLRSRMLNDRHLSLCIPLIQAREPLGRGFQAAGRRGQQFAVTLKKRRIVMAMLDEHNSVKAMLAVLVEMIVGICRKQGNADRT
jgi:hypothetical protein